MTTDTIGGVWTYTAHLTEALAAKDVDITIVSLGALPEKKQVCELKNIKRVELIPTPFKLEWMRDSDADVEASKRFIMDVSEHIKPDIFHSNQFCFSSLRLGVPKVVVAHSDMLSWWSWRFYKGGDFQPEPFLLEYQKKVRKSLLSADAIVCPSEFMADNLRRFYDPGIQRISVIYNGIPPDASPANCFRKRRAAVTVGRLWDQGKNAASVVEAAKLIPDLQFILVGPTKGPDGNELHVDAAENVRFTGKLTPEQVRRLMWRSAIYIGPSTYEPFGLSPLEAAMSGCTLVLSDIPSFREIWEDSALYFTADKPDTLAEVLRSLVDKPDVVCRHSAMARFRAYKFYTADHMADQYLKLYEQLLSPARRKSHVLW